MQTQTMTHGQPWKHIVRFAAPVLAGSLLQQLYNTVDAIVVGNFSGEASLSAVGTTGSFAFLFLAIALGFSAGNGVVVAQHYGAGNEEQVRQNASTGILFLMTLGVVFALLGFAVARPAFTLIVNVPEDYLELTLRYFRVYALGLVFQYGYNIFSSIMRAVGDSRATLYFLLIASVMNILLDLLFVAVFGWGVTGAAAATVIAQAASFVAAYVYMTRKYPIFRFARSDYRWSLPHIRQTVRVGLPISLQLIIVSLGLTLIQRAVNGFGQAMTASFTVGNRIEMYLNLPCNAFQTTLATYTGQNIGAGRLDRVKLGTRQTIALSLGLTLVISGAVWLLADGILTLFGLSDQAAVYCLQHLRTVALVNVILSLYVPLFGVFQGANHSGFPAIVATCALTTRVLVTYLLKDSAFLGYRIIWWNGLFGFGMGFTVSWLYYLSGRWQRNSAIGR
ncbi:MAG: MATE family efflux transporter [Clostridia bacterium]|nr:MATE family efflux transporter [Clostridia bacterium]